MSQPSVGGIVHYRSHGSADGAYPPDSDLVGLAVLNPGGAFFRPIDGGGCAHDESLHHGGTWHWPERA
jgi:hypothetical protein